MAVISTQVTLGGVNLKKYYSDKDTKIKCTNDNNIYSVAYTALNSNVEFVDTDYPLNDLSAGAPINVTDISGLSEYIQNVKLSASNIVDLSSYIENEINVSAVTQISATDVLGLSDYIENVIDISFDGKDDDIVNVDLGSSTIGNEI